MQYRERKRQGRREAASRDLRGFTAVRQGFSHDATVAACLTAARDHDSITEVDHTRRHQSQKAERGLSMRARILLIAGLFLGLATLALGAFAPAPSRPKPAPTRLRCEGPTGDWKDDVKVLTAGNQTVIRITWGRGIGSATVTLESGEWPQRVRLEFQEFGNLETLALEHGDLSLTTSLSNSPTTYVGLKQKNGEYDYNAKEPKIEIPMKRHGENKKDWLITADLPRGLLKNDVKTLTLFWIDAHRK
jgi:hypothetical protein